MTIDDLLKGTEVVRMHHVPPGLPVGGLHYDSRRIQPGEIFFAIQGEQTDGRLYVPKAVERGAAAVVAEGPPPDNALPWIEVRQARRSLAIAAANFYHQPARSLTLAGVTGTNGKTTTTFLLHGMLEAAGITAGLFGTIEYRLGAQRLPAPNTTPESLDLQRLLAELRAAGGTHAVLEVSSHALALDRVYGDTFRVAVFTNLTRDHLDFHGDMESYFAAKKLLFTGLGAPPPECAVLNADDPRSGQLSACGNRRVIWYGVTRTADITEEAGVIRTPLGAVRNTSALIGRPNTYNRLAAVAAAVALGISRPAIEEGLARVAAVPGRLERIDAGQPFTVLVDYAHTDDALRNVLGAVRELAGHSGGRVITVFGCGGDRDRSKRPLMGEAAATLSDLAIVTSDNPRSEQPAAIIADALEGVRPTGRPYVAEPDRAQAIALAIRQARPGDVVLIAGKGHETYQVIGARTIPFDDREVARQALAQRC